MPSNIDFDIEKFGNSFLNNSNTKNFKNDTTNQEQIQYDIPNQEQIPDDITIFGNQYLSQQKPFQGVASLNPQNYSQDEDIYGKELSPLEINNPEKSTSTSTIALTNLFKDPQNKIKVYAKSRGIPIEKYTIIDDEIVFQGDDGKLYREESSGALPWAKRTAIELGTDPTTWMGAGAGGIATKAGSKIAGKVGKGLLNIGAEAAGATLGELTKQQTAASMGEDRPAKEDIFDIGMTVGTGLGTQGVLKGTKWAGDKVIDFLNIPTPGGNKKKIAKILNDAGVLNKNEIYKIANVEQKANQFGINLNIVEKSEDIQAISKLKNISSIEKNKLIQERAQDISEKVPTFVRQILPKSNKLPSVNAKKYINDSLEGLSKETTNILKPFYDSAFAGDPKINTKNIIKYIDSVSDPKVASAKKQMALRRLKRDLISIKPNKSKKINYELSLKKLDEIKKEIDEGIYGKKWGSFSSYSKSINNELSKVRDLLVESADEVSPEYQRAREIASLLYNGSEKLRTSSIPDADKFAALGDEFIYKKGLLSNAANIPDSELHLIGSYILSSSKSSPTMASAVKESIVNNENGEEIWKSIVGDYMLYNFDQIAQSPYQIRPDIGGEMWKSLFDTPQKKEMMKVALPIQEYATLYDFFDIIRKTGVVVTPAIKGSPSSEIKEEFISPILRSLKPFISKETIIADATQKIATSKGMNQFMDVLWNKDVGPELFELKKIYEKTKNKDFLMDRLISIMGWSTASELKNITE